MNKERNLNYDLLRLLGLFIIMVAHSSPPEWLFQLRNFGTPLLVIGSALTYALIFRNKKIDYKAFLKKRMVRLILPTWIFLSFFFVTFLIYGELIGNEYPFSINTIFSSYIFLGGIGFVWVFKIYIILALITPIAIIFNNKVHKNTHYFMALILMYITYELLVYFVNPLVNETIHRLFNSIVFILIPYSILYLYGFRLATLKSKNIVIISIMSLIVFLFLLTIKYVDSGSFIPTQQFKYPPTLYYLSYAFFAINILYLLIKRIPISSLITKRIIVWLSSNSLWIYLWHIMAFYIWKASLPNPQEQFYIFVAKTFFLLVFGIVCVAIQNRLVAKTLTKNLYCRKYIAPLLSSNF